MRLSKQNIIHILIIILGIIFILIPAFHENIWFDESYSVAMSKHNFIDIWQIGGNDVHPVLYYWILKLINIVFGYNIIAYRLFSALCIAILGILGYTHIRKDFGDKVGLFFSFLVYFIPAMNTYAQEIRMYSFACLVVFLMCIYAYRFYKSIKEKDGKVIKNLIFFGIFSIASCYTHYYALATAGFVNLLLLIYIIKNIKENHKVLIKFLILGIIHILLYIPWLKFMIGQVNHVNNGFWIILDKVRTPVEMTIFQFKRQLDTNFEFNIHTIIALCSVILLFIYLVYLVIKAKKNKKSLKPALLSFGVYFGIILIVYIISKIKSPILFARYLMVITGLYIFAISYIMQFEKRKWFTFAVCVIVLLLGTFSNFENILINYAPDNMKFVDYIKEEIKEDDILLYSNIGNGGVIAAYFPNNKQYFYNGAHWDVEEAYKAYGPGMETVESYDVLKDYKGRIWLIDSENMGLWDEIPKENITVLKDAKRFDTKYHDYIYNIMLVEK